MSSACRNGCAAIGSPAIGMMSSGWTRLVLPTPPSPTAISPSAVARHKGMFFAEKAADRTPIDYAVAVNGGLHLVPAGDALKALEEDYGPHGR